ncbi:hypothetical protein CNMCM6106_007947 [Aspergillus hiratsukae]|uniref:F-box domain-containing protein n=1 Tax=Aspergillus hiratsukae TaxID=1194566 RepID=A0A8H6QHA9_9EURO|nr:hypothetical protein CNMCM6106_007947 [Aspergillus hiratsukae]
MMKLSFNSPSYISMLSSSGYSTVMDSTISITQLPGEILEEILLNLSQRDLLLSLLRKLFFVPGTLANGKAQVNRLLQELFPPFFPNKQTVSSRWNALLAPLGVPWIKSLPWYKSEVRRAAVLRQDASWRRMFLSHPAPRLGDIVALETDSNDNVNTFVGDIADEDGEMGKSGVQMGLLFDIAVHMVDSVLWGGDFSVHWRMVNQGSVIEGKDPVLVIGLYAQRTTIVVNGGTLPGVNDIHILSRRIL